MWENTVITDAGITLVAGLMAGGTIRVSSVKSGAGAVESDVLKEQTTVSQPKQTAAIQKIEKVNDYIQLSVLFTNQGLAASYGMKQVGIFVESEGQEILFAISQTEIAKEIPSETVSPSYSLVQKFRFQFKRDISMTAIIDPEGLCSMELYQELEDRVEEIESPSFETADTRMNIFSEDGLSVILGKLQKWYEDFAQIAFSGSYEDLSDKPGIANNLTTTTDGSVLDARQGKILAERIDALNELNSNKLEYNFITLSDNAYPFSENEQTLIFNAIKKCKVLFVKIGYASSAEISLANGYTESTVVLCNFIDRTICTEGVRIYTNPNWNFLGAITVDFSNGSLKIRCSNVTGWTAGQFTVKRVYSLL